MPRPLGESRAAHSRDDPDIARRVEVAPLDPAFAHKVGQVLVHRRHGAEAEPVGQLLEGLRAREESWRRTAEYFRLGCRDDFFLIEECNGEYEANEIALIYGRIISNIERQRDEQLKIQA